jgi:leucyl aminopeptidase (aminopeptidase T)
MTATTRADMRLIKEGSLMLLSKCLELNAGDVLALFWDETVEETAKILAEAATKFGLVIMERKVSLEYQKAFVEGDVLSIEDKDALESARAIITCLSDHTAATTYRQTLLREGTSMGKRFGHMPGANKDLLAYAATIDYEHAVTRCDDLALVLTLGRKARLQTYVHKENGERLAYNLDFDLGGFDRYPITSNGIISLGTWGNIPGGETFIAPMEDTANGTFVLNGAFKNYVVKPPDHLLLHFEKGNLKDKHVEGTPDVLENFNPFLDYARARGDKFFNSLAELGIGVNTSITELTGKALFDEKCYGTAHIAIGDNTRYGGYHTSKIHEDLITRSPTLWVDDKLILKDGEDAFNPQEWRESLATFRIEGWDEKAPTTLTRTHTHAEASPSGKLQVKQGVAAGRVCIYTVGDDHTSEVLASVFSKVPITPGHVMSVRDLAEAAVSDPKLGPDQVRKALSILERHKLISLS